MFLFFKKDKLAVIRLAAFIAFMLAMFMSWNLWFSDRSFPMATFFNWLPVPNSTVDVILILLFVIFFGVFVFKPNWKVGGVITLLYVYWALLDQNRLQPFFFELIFVVFAISYYKGDKKLAKQCLLLIFVGTYFWSGMHKYNDLFFEKWMNGLSKRIPFVPYWMRAVFTYAIPFLEAAFGLGLIFIKTRKIAIWLIAIMHMIILTTFLKGGFGYIVFPLTVFNVFTLFYMFYNDKENSFVEVFQFNSLKKVIFILLMLVLPFFNLVGRYDHILAFSYFSGKPKYCRIHFQDKEATLKLPNLIQKNVKEYNGAYYLDLNEWSTRSIHVLVYPEMRVYKKVQQHVDQYVDSPTQLGFY